MQKTETRPILDLQRRITPLGSTLLRETVGVGSQYEFNIDGVIGQANYTGPECPFVVSHFNYDKEGLNVGSRVSFKPTALDSLTAPTATIEYTIPSLECTNGMSIEGFDGKQTLKVNTEPNGDKTVSTDYFRHINFNLYLQDRRDVGIAKLAAKLGFVLSEDAASPGAYITGVPSPETLQKYLAENFDVLIRYFTEVEQIPNEDFMQTFKAGKYTASSFNDAGYGHDIDLNIHLAAIALGGKPLAAALQIAAQKQITDNTLTQGVGNLDQYTLLLTAVILNPSSAVSELDRPKALAGLYQRGEDLGIPSETTTDIINHAIAKAIEIGMNPDPLLDERS